MNRTRERLTARRDGTRESLHSQGHRVIPDSLTSRFLGEDFHDVSRLCLNYVNTQSRLVLLLRAIRHAPAD